MHTPFPTERQVVRPCPSYLAAESFVPGRCQTYFETTNVVDASLLERHQVSDLGLG